MSEQITTVEVNGVTINYRLEGTGSGDLVVLINGLADDLGSWDYQVPALLNAGYRVLRYDNRGIGKSSKPGGKYTAELMAGDLRALLAGLNINEGFHLMGVSMGGMIGQAYALMYPNSSPTSGAHILSLSLCCTYAQPTNFCSRMFDLWADMAQHMSVSDVMRDVMLWAFTVPFFRTRENDLAIFEEAMKQLDMPLEAYLGQLNAIQVFNTETALAETEKLGGLSGDKIMVLAGEEDILIPVQLSKELSEKIAGSKFVTTRGGHGCMWEFPDEFNKIFIVFLNKHQQRK
ncbi:Hypothetical protein R9X50_00041500 [Acrodontium crateriforme]|uniref:AB hydrolase-1 domain-containing protein n=1 Tax=Acrodontium crateriforme TaxID=150365 RepID=A0AAQ3R207_9PEZI|nr:Hypothetical protein R9X50_00041500 [Acrodontium crateriforme]